VSGVTWSGRRVLVTGAGGFIGSHLAERLVALGAEVRALVHYRGNGSWGWLDESPVRGDMEVVAGDVCDRDSVGTAMRGADVVYHLAALIAIPYSYHAPLSYVRTNVEGTLNVLQLARELGVEGARIRRALKKFSGVHRRFEVKGERGGIMVIDDYGHHPTEIRATIGAIRDSWKGPLTVIFQPHRFTRTRDLFDEFLTAFEGADRLVLTEIYAAGEDPIAGANGEALYQAIKRKGHLDIQFIADKNDIVSQLAGQLCGGDVVLTLGAGDIDKVGEALVAALK